VNFNSNGSMWDSPKKEPLRASPTKMGRPSQERRTNDRSKCRMECLSDG